MSNKNDSNTTTNSGIGFVGLLTILFIGLKLTGYINWSWWWILSPLWIATGLTLLVLVVILIVIIIKQS
jgi:membrane protein YdbS with pleckstrin-like domain